MGMGREYPNPTGMGMRFDFSSPVGMGRVMGKYISVGYGDRKGKTRLVPPHRGESLHMNGVALATPKEK